MILEFRASSEAFLDEATVATLQALFRRRREAQKIRELLNFHNFMCNEPTRDVARLAIKRIVNFIKSFT